MKYQHIICVDFEYRALDGHRPEIRCMVSKDIITGKLTELWADSLNSLSAPPFPIGPEILIVCYAATAEMSCFFQLGWGVPHNILDLYTEHKALYNNAKINGNFNLIGLKALHGLSTLSEKDKDTFRNLATENRRSHEYSRQDRSALIDYCRDDVFALVHLLPKMSSVIHLPTALFRGHYMASVAWMGHVGIPIDADIMSNLAKHRQEMIDSYLKAEGYFHGIYDGGHFKEKRYYVWLKENGIDMPLTESRKPSLRDDVLKDLGFIYPEIKRLREIRRTLVFLRRFNVNVGADGRSRPYLNPLGSKTGRNQPPTKHFIFGASKWLRGFVKPPLGHGVAYIDWVSQEIAIAAHLSKDKNMITAYMNEDPYISFGIQSGLIPPGGTKKTHPEERRLCKICLLASLYDISGDSLAIRLGKPPAVGQQMRRLFRDTFKTYVEWSRCVVNFALQNGKLRTVLNWLINVRPNINPRTLKNFPIQGAGANIMQMASILAMEAGIQVACPVHDAFLIIYRIPEKKKTIQKMQHIMETAAELVIGLKIRTDVKAFDYPNRYRDDNAGEFWDFAMKLLNNISKKSA